MLPRLTDMLSLPPTPFWGTLALACGSFFIILPKSARRKAVIACYLPFLLLSELVKFGLRFSSVLQSSSNGAKVATSGVDESAFPENKEFERILDRIGNAGARTTGSGAHNDLIDWTENELRSIPGLPIRVDEFDILKWQTTNGRALEEAGKFMVSTSGEEQNISIAGAVPFSLPTASQGKPMIYVP